MWLLVWEAALDVSAGTVKLFLSLKATNGAVFWQYNPHSCSHTNPTWNIWAVASGSIAEKEEVVAKAGMDLCEPAEL